MPALTNPKHERFAQLLAKGENAAEAYVQAGYRYNDGNCIRLKGDERIQARVAEILERAAVKVEVTVESLIAEAHEIQTQALQAGQFAAATGALTAKAKIAGKWVERSESGKPGDFDRMTDDELERFIAAEAAALGASDAGAAEANHKAGMRKQPRGLH